MKNVFNRFLTLVLCFLFLQGYSQRLQIEGVAPGVVKIISGTVDRFTPYSFVDQKPLVAALKQLPQAALPFNMNDVKVRVTTRGTVVEIPLNDDEHLYGFGLQAGSFDQKGLKKKPVVNAYPLNNLGYSHAPVPYYVSTKGYAILINTSRYTTFYCGNLDRSTESNSDSVATKSGQTATTIDELYKNNHHSSKAVTVDIPGAKGAEIFVFLGPDMGHAVQRYNLFGGGGALPAIWGLGVKYRVKADSKQEDVYKIAQYFRDKDIPCDVLGLEPKWQTAAYSCSYVWNSEYFPRPQQLIDSMKRQNFEINLWEHAFVSQKSPLYEKLKEHAGDYHVWKGLVPDFADSATRNVFGDYHYQNFIAQGISGFKLDESDNSDITKGDENWSWPELSRFPSGIDGEQMHQLYGLLYLRSLYNEYQKRNQRVFFDVRASGAFASSYAASLYSDTYDHKEYIQMIANSGFSGLLWSPEVRESHSVKELLRRSQTAILSAQALFNSWYLKNPPWLQFETTANNEDIFLSNAKEVEAQVRQLLNFRMSLVPYLYSAFAIYKQQGVPPFRALVMDYPDDKNVYNIFDEYMIGESILAAPLTGESSERKVYLPKGTWYNFNTNEKLEGGREYKIATDLTQIPIFVKAGAILPLAEPVESIAPSTIFNLTCKVYGASAAKATLFEDDGTSYDFEKGTYNTWHMSYVDGKPTIKKKGNYKNIRYKIAKWTLIK